MIATNHDISRSIPRPDGRAKASGSTRYIGDVPYRDALTARFFRAGFSRGRIRQVNLPDIPEGYHVVDHRDIPTGGANHVALIKTDWPAFAGDEIRYQGQIVAVVAGPDPAVVDRILSEITVDCDPLETAVTLDEGLACRGGPMHGSDNIYADLTITQGDPGSAFSGAARIVEGRYSTGFQEQMYMETQGIVAWVETDEPDGSSRDVGVASPTDSSAVPRRKVVIHGSLQCAFYVKHAVEETVGPDFDVQVIEGTTGGAFGGKEDYPEIMAAPLAVAAITIGKPLRMIFDRHEDLSWTSKRHPSRTVVRTAHDTDGTIRGMEFDIILDGGAYESYSTIVLQRAIFHATGAYRIPNVRIHGRAVATTTVPSGAFRGFGAPQALFAIEMHMERIAREFGLSPVAVRRPCLLKKGDPTVTGGTIREEVIINDLIDRALALSDFRSKWARYNATPWKGIGISVFNHGCGFTGDGEQRIIKGKASLRKSPSGEVEILVASMDMGQGPKTTFRKVVGAVLGIPPEEVLYENPDTDRVPNSGPTVASRTIMIVGYLLQEAAKDLKATWIDGEEQIVTREYTMPPGMAWDQDTLSGDAYAVYGWGVNVVEVSVDPVSWEPSVTGAWGVYDVGVPIDERVVAGQIQGGMSQALGFGSLENLEVDADGVFRQRTMADYIVATSMDFPATTAETLPNPYEFGPFGAKGMGEMVHDGGHAAYAAAVQHALGRPCDAIPVTPERIAEIMR
jgi:CO/xanthine dehydrogenase Mo-binding subunit